MAKKQEESGLKKIYLNLPKIYFILQILLGLVMAYWVLIYHQPKTGDDVEHMHSAWLVYNGQIPYIDFFQHHNPLLWYIFAPLVGYFAYDLIIFDTVRVISTIVMFITLIYAAKISEKFLGKSKYSALLTIASVFPSYIVFSGQDFRPDNYMVFTFIAGLYYFFAYLEEQKAKRLVYAFFLMFLSFMFMQKSIFFLSLIGIITLYLLYTKKIQWNDFLKAVILPVLGAVFFVSWLLYHGMLERYWLSNFIFNLYIPEVYNNLAEPTKTEFYGLSALAFISFCYFMIKGNMAARIVCILWISEAIQRFFYFSLDRHYYYFLDILNAILVGSFLYILIKRWNWMAYIGVALSISALIPFKTYCINNKLSPDYHRYVTPKYILEQTNKCDSVLNGYGLTYGIYTKDINYYWNLYGQLDVIGEKIGLAPLPNLDRIVEQQLPKIIYTGPFWNERLRKRNQYVPVHWISSYIRDKYYEQSIFVDVFILKDEYQQKRRCRYDAKNNTWNYYYKE